MTLVQVMREEWADRTVALPSYQTAGAAGADVCANLPEADRAGGIVIAPMERVIVPTGIRVAVAVGYEMQIRPRSGLAVKFGITLPNTPGTIDSDYRGPLGVALVNLGAEPYVVRHGDRIAQCVVAPVVQAGFQVVESLDETARGAGGFGSTGFGQAAPRSSGKD
ncbi:dUTP diphosphatase [Cypionkella psychrotolerans]|uniref:dUTP diphosphatase n=1 Tax=Cypionkella psychrotolerans TaxID=1678131 RepID=UPI0006B63367|nr:dUTP diphosphatase [Cypionkella psychrotolerans]